MEVGVLTEYQEMVLAWLPMTPGQPGAEDERVLRREADAAFQAYQEAAVESLGRTIRSRIRGFLDNYQATVLEDAATPDGPWEEPLAQILGVHRSTVSRKMSGALSFQLDWVFRLDVKFPDWALFEHTVIEACRVEGLCKGVERVRGLLIERGLLSPECAPLKLTRPRCWCLRSMYAIDGWQGRPTPPRFAELVAKVVAKSTGANQTIEPTHGCDAGNETSRPTFAEVAQLDRDWGKAFLLALYYLSGID